MTKSFTAVTLLSITIGLSICSDTHAVGYGGLFSSVLGQSGGENMNVDEALSRMSEKMNRRMPQAVDAETRLDSVNAEPGHQFAYHYTILNVHSRDLPTAGFYRYRRLSSSAGTASSRRATSTRTTEPGWKSIRSSMRCGRRHRASCQTLTLATQLVMVGLVPTITPSSISGRAAA